MWPSDLNHGGVLTSHGVTNRLLLGFKTTKASSQFKLGLAIKKQNPTDSFEF